MIRRRAFATGSVVALVVIGIVAGTALAPTRGGPAARTSPSSSSLSQPSGGEASPGAGATGAVTRPGHEVYGFVPDWEMDDSIAAHVARTDLSTLALFSVMNRRNGAMATDTRGYRRITGSVGRSLIRTAHEKGIRAEVVYSSFGAARNRRFFDDGEAQARWIEELVRFVEDQELDGIDVDVEVLPVELVPAYGRFVGRLREALRARLPEAQLSVATQANPLGAAMALAAARAGADRIFLMGYDYHWAGSKPGASAPLEQLDGDAHDLGASLELYRVLGVPVERTLLGLPLYGMTWPVIGPGLGSPARGRGEGWVPRRNLEVLENPSFEPRYDPIESVEFYAVPGDPFPAAGEDTPPVEPGADPEGAEASLPPTAVPAGVEESWQAVYYDSPRSLTPKLALADARGLAGAGFWAIGYERGLPGYTELISEFRAGKVNLPP
ncbi:MAG: hypothetical protein H0U58_02205 [Chloroflexi bacterium]|nr:hypothetical protein [Chloroflexota bacterium]